MLFVSFLGAGGSTASARLISPGELSKAHEKLDSFLYCLKCHELTTSLQDYDCTACHEKLNERIKGKKGFHAQVKGGCIECHTEHKGKDFDIVQLDREKFDHDMTGYKLRDSHIKACDKCHKKENTFLDLSPECINCHSDAHKKTVSSECGTCHNFKEWKNVEFDHDKSSVFKLTGKHSGIDCELCHPQSTGAALSPGYKAFKVLKFKPLKYGTCNDCHGDVHRGKLKEQNCSGCHITAGWNEKVFDHNDPLLSDFSLQGRHKEASCELCHARETVTFREDGKLNKRSILKLDSVKKDLCTDCHYDLHKGQFGKQKCDSCHSLKKGWKDITFSHESATYSGFKLKGKHRDARCEDCHERSEVSYREFNTVKKKSIGKFKPLKAAQCTDCHFDIHNGKFTKQKCDGCHSVNNGWKDNTFDHNSDTYGGYKLEGKHRELVCHKCHKKSEIIYREFNREKKKSVSSFKTLKTEKCSECHKEEHKKRFVGIREVKDVSCSTCHSIEKEWKDYEYRHESEIKFKKYSLEFKAEISECEKCHSCSSEVFCTSCCLRRCMPCNFKQKIFQSKDAELYELIDREP